MKKEYKLSFSAKLYNICQIHPFFRRLKVILYFIDKILVFFIPKPIKKSLNNKKTIFIMFNYALGDAVIWLTVFKNIRKIYAKQKYHITIMCNKGLRDVFNATKIFDRIEAYDLVPATYNIKKRYNLYKFLRSENYDIILDPIGITECTSNIFMSKIMCASEKISIIDSINNKILCPKWLYTGTYSTIFEISKKGISLIEYYAEFIRNLGYHELNISLDLSIGVKCTPIIPKKYFIIFPSAGNYLKRWPIERYAEIAKRVYQSLNIPLLLCGTNVDDGAYTQMLKNIDDIPYVNIIGQTSILEFINVIKMASLVITNDTSTYHIAVTQEVPVAIITGGYTYNRYVKYKFYGSENYKEPCIIVNKRKCFNCDNRCKYLKPCDKIWPCLNDITVEYAWNKIEKYIKERKI